ncbi:SIMPL domain-containing protein [Sulfitobacter aestuarii]|uniref:SIMPL domain-containing protein n=1 Tax=Sulfitobacter aestuarii TaxID=2161676 RepID=A0ABW5TYB6_9RHOB
MMKLMQVALLVWVGWAGAALAQEVQEGIIVNGEGEVALAPDMATITLGVSEVAASAREAMSEVSGAVEEIVAKLDEFGVAPGDRQTEHFYVRPVYQHRQDPVQSEREAPQITGYEAGNSVTVRIRDLSRIGALLDQVIDEGANDFHGISFGLQDDTAALAEARKLAVADAMARAEDMAEAAGLALGAVTRMSENSFSNRPAMMEMSKARGAADVPIEQGELTVRAQVTMVFSIAPGK